jgi:hypothetical protein
VEAVLVEVALIFFADDRLELEQKKKKKKKEKKKT